MVLAAARIADRLGGVVDGMTTGGTDCVCSPGRFEAGTAPNVIPTVAVVEATLRTFDSSQRVAALAALAELAAEVGAEFDVEVEVATTASTDPVRNDPGVAAVAMAAARRVVGGGAIELPGPVAASDDVSVFLDRIPGCYLAVGSGPTDGTGGVHHSPTFAIDEAALRIGAAVLASAAADLTARGTGV